jgi:hypothetical protein
MPKKNQEPATNSDIPTPKPRITLNLFAETNRGMLFDLLIFLANLFLMSLLTEFFVDLFSEVSADNPLAKFILGMTALAMWILPAAGSVFKRWHFHERLKMERKALVTPYDKLAGCLFNPIFYFCLNLVITSVVLTGLGEVLFGRQLLNNGPLFISLVIAGMILTIFQTYLIFRYFTPPKEPPHWEFLMTPQSELLGDIFLFLNMILFQVAWNFLTLAPLGPPSGVGEFAGRLFFLLFIALLIYFPPRMFFLAEDINRPRTWMTMLLANSPVIIRVLFGIQDLS